MKSCLRCTKAGRTCGGYEEDASIIFRPYDSPGHLLLPFKSMARKCSLPVRIPGPGTDLPEDTTPKETSDEEVEGYALRAFFYSYCIVSMNQSISLGYLSGLEWIVRRSEMHSDIARACKAVALATAGIKLRRPVLTRKAEALYHDLLWSSARTMKNPAFAHTAESLVVAVLLGLYEVCLEICYGYVTNTRQMITTNDVNFGNHQAHARGVAAILQVGNSPLDLVAAVRRE